MLNSGKTIYYIKITGRKIMLFLSIHICICLQDQFLRISRKSDVIVRHFLKLVKACKNKPNLLS